MRSQNLSTLLQHLQHLPAITAEKDAWPSWLISGEASFNILTLNISKFHAETRVLIIENSLIKHLILSLFWYENLYSPEKPTRQAWGAKLVPSELEAGLQLLLEARRQSSTAEPTGRAYSDSPRPRQRPRPSSSACAVS